MRCPNCEANDWENVDFARIKPQKMCMCKSCGFVSYPDKWKTKEEILKHYRSSYRQPPTHFNMYAGERKNHFHHAFLLDLFNEWKVKGLDAPRILEVGSAMGYTLFWLKQMFPKAHVVGTELTTSMRRVAAHEFGIKLDEDFDDKEKYDLIISYKVLEHQLDPDIELARYQKMLTPDGRMYMSVPTWFDTMTNFGLSGFDLEYYYDPNHINVWTRKMFEGMLARKGFEVVKTDYVVYSSTYLCKANDSLIGSAPHKENTAEIKTKLQKIKDAYMLFTENRFAEAIALWPDYPTAHIQLLEMSRKNLKDMGWETFKTQYIEKALKDCPDSGLADILITATDFAMRAQQWKEAIAYCEKALLAKPENPTSLHHMCNIMREMAISAKNQNERVHYFIQALDVARHLRQTSTQHFKEATDLIFLYESQLAFKGEAVAAPQMPLSAPLEPKGLDHAQHEASL